MKKGISELRQDLVSDDWVVIATGRGKRPGDFLKQKHPSFKQPRSTCPFEKLLPQTLLTYSLPGTGIKDNWWTTVVPNKYPAFGMGVCSIFHRCGPYQWTEGVGFHEVVITRDHERSLAQMSDAEAELVLRVYQDRYVFMKEDKCVKYILILHNHGRLSGATISHPHSQIVALPVIPPDVGRSLKGSAVYYHQNKSCVHCLMIEYELNAKDRVVYENDHFVVVAPYASKSAFEIRVFPKRHGAHFEEIDFKERMALANSLRTSLGKLFRGLKNPDYNFFLHTAPVDSVQEFHHYHWHFEIVPKTAIWGGFEIGTGIEISTIAPESAAKFLRGIKV